MNYKGKKVTGVWIDHKHAYLIGTPDRNNDGTYGIIKKIEAVELIDHNRSEKTHHTKEDQILKGLYKDVTAQLESDDAIYIIGPGTAQEELRNFLKENKHFKDKEIEIGTADHLTTNEMIAQIRTHFFHN